MWRRVQDSAKNPVSRLKSELTIVQARNRIVDHPLRLKKPGFLWVIQLQRQIFHKNPVSDYPRVSPTNCWPLTRGTDFSA